MREVIDRAAELVARKILRTAGRVAQPDSDRFAEESRDLP
jgi:hypothetical protein